MLGVNAEGFLKLKLLVFIWGVLITTITYTNYRSPVKSAQLPSADWTAIWAAVGWRISASHLVQSQGPRHRQSWTKTIKQNALICWEEKHQKIKKVNASIVKPTNIFRKCRQVHGRRKHVLTFRSQGAVLMHHPNPEPPPEKEHTCLH